VSEHSVNSSVRGFADSADTWAWQENHLARLGIKRLSWEKKIYAGI
jgi:hypothetical protein